MAVPGGILTLWGIAISQQAGNWLDKAWDPSGYFLILPVQIFGDFVAELAGCRHSRDYLGLTLRVRTRERPEISAQDPKGTVTPYVSPGPYVSTHCG